MSKYIPCPWCGNQPEEYTKWGDDGFSQKRFGCTTKDCPVKPFIGMSFSTLDHAIENWQKMNVFKKLQAMVSELERTQNSDCRSGWPFEEPKAP